MGFSLDSSTDTTTVDNNSLNAKVTAALGKHTLHVKAWGDKGASCVTDVTITVGNVAAQSTSVTASNSVNVSSPANGSSVTSPFSLAANASTCSSESVNTMGYSLDSSSNTAIVDATSVRASVTATTGKHTLHVKAWGGQGTACDTDVAITITAQSTSTSTSNGVTINTPAKGATVASPFALSANASSCSSQSVSAMGYSLDSSSNTTVVDSESVNARVSAASGSHTLHVKAWGSKGASCDADVSITVNGGSAPPTGGGPSIPSNATSVSSLQSLGDWNASHDKGGPGSSSGSMSMVSSPSLSGHARRFVTKFSNAGDERYSVSFGDDASASNFVYDAYVYVASPSSKIANLEMDLNQVMSNGQTVIYGFQCDGYSGKWAYAENKGTPSKSSAHWIASGASCNVRSWSTNTWHHIQVSYSRSSSGKVTYKSVWFDGKQSTLNVTVPSAFALGWGAIMSTNFQVDGLGSSGTVTLYLDKLTIYRW
jgi:FlaG/FlaF family flagellin (archaellin)